MDLLGEIIQYLLILIVVGGVGFFSWKVWLKKKRPKELPIQYQYRLMVAIKRRQAGISLFINMGPDEQQGHIEQLDAQWQSLHNRLSRHGKFVNAFVAIDYGLPSGGEEEWTTFVFYDLVDYNAYRRCMNILDENEFMILRNHCEVRLIPGKTGAEVAGLVKGLF